MSDTRPVRPPWSSFRAALESAGFRPSRRLGQNFLLDDNMARAIAQDAGVEPGDRVLEIGPGCGFLSVHLAHAGARLLCIEVDPRLAPIAREFLEPYPDAEVVLADALAGKNRLGPEIEAWLAEAPDEPWRLAANLPYSISGPFLALIASLDRPADSITVLVQKEVAERLAARPGTGDFGPLALAMQLAFDVEVGRSVPAGLFWPRPKVESAVGLARLRADRASGEERRATIALARTMFTRRRQGLRRVLGDHLGDRERAEACLVSVGLDPAQRAETVDPGTWLRLAAQIGQGNEKKADSGRESGPDAG